MDQLAQGNQDNSLLIRALADAVTALQRHPPPSSDTTVEQALAELEAGRTESAERLFADVLDAQAGRRSPGPC